MWTHETIERLRVLAGLGLSSTEIAARLGEGFTKNAVIGKCARLGIPLDGLKRFRQQTWPQERLNVLEQMCRAGETSSVIALALNKLEGPYLSDGAVRTRAWMMGFKVGGGQAAQRKKAARPMRSLKSFDQRLRQAAATEPGPEGGVRLIDIGLFQCRYPLGDPHDYEAFRFCGAPVREGSSYCRSHHALCLHPAPKKVKPKSDAQPPVRVNQL